MPQCSALVATLTHMRPHCSRPEPQSASQAEFEQTSSSAQARLHAPQWSGSDAVSTHASQRSRPGWQTQSPEMHDSPIPHAGEHSLGLLDPPAPAPGRLQNPSLQSSPASQLSLP
jgi:hypothetical protein